MAKRVYSESVKKWAIATGVPAGVIGAVIFLYLMYLASLGVITVTGYSGDVVCEGTQDDPCYAYINFTANNDTFFYIVGYDPWGRDVPFNFSPAVKSWKLQRSWGSGWRDIDLENGCTGSWCGCSYCSVNNTATYAYAFRAGRSYQIRVVGYKNYPSDTIKWGFDKIDPYWWGENGVYNIPLTQLPYTDLDISQVGDTFNYTWNSSQEHTTIRGFFFYVGNGQTYNFSDANSFGVTYDFWVNYNTGITLKWGGMINTSEVNPAILANGYYPAFELIDYTTEPTINGSKLWLNKYVSLEWKDLYNFNNSFQIYNKTVVYLRNRTANYNSTGDFDNYTYGPFHGTVIYDPTVTIEDVSINGSTYNIRGESNFTHLEIDDTASPYDSLIAYWPFDGDPVDARLNKSYDFTDDSYDGTMVNDAHVNASNCMDNYGNCLQLNSATEDYINIQDADMVDGVGWDEATYIFWEYHTTFGGAADGFITSSSNSPLIYIYGIDDLRLLVYNTTNDQAVRMDIVNSLLPNRWNFVALSYNSTDGYGYINDNVWHDATVMPPYRNITDLFIGSNRGYSGRSINGSMDEVMIFNVSLTPAQVRAIYYNTSSRFKTFGHHNFTVDGMASGYNRLNVTTELSANFSGQIELSAEYYDGSWHTTTQRNLSVNSGFNTTTFTITTGTTNATLNYTIYPGNQTANPFMTPIMKNDIVMETFTVSVGDTTSPDNVGFLDPTPSNDTNLTQNNYFVNVSFNDTNPDWCELEIINTSGTINYTMTQGANTSEYYFNITMQYDNMTHITAYCNDTSDNINASATRSVRINRPPQYSNNLTNGTTAGAYIEHNVSWSDTGGLGNYTFEFCNGTWNGTDCVGNVSKLCYQESSNESSACGGLDTGTYEYWGTWDAGYEAPRATDGSWSTEALPDSADDVLYINYTKPNGALNTSFWMMKDSEGIENHTIPPSCWDYDPDKITFNMSGVYGAVGPCLDGNTYIRTANGNKRIKDIQAGDVVYGYDDGEIVENMVEDVIVSNLDNAGNRYYEIYSSDGTMIRATGNHRVYANGIYTRAENLIVEQELLNSDLSRSTITEIKIVEAYGKTYDLLIENSHNFFANNMLVHNPWYTHHFCFNGTGWALIQGGDILYVFEEAMWWNISTSGDGGWVNDSSVSMTGTTNTSSTTKGINVTTGAVIAWRYYGYDLESQLNATPIYVYTTTSAGDTCDTCTIDCTENCVVDSDLDCQGGPLTFTGAGTIGIQAKITNYNKVLTDNSGCAIICSGGNCII